LTYQPPASNTFLSEQTSHQQRAVLFSQNKPATSNEQYFSLRTNQHQPSATSQTKRVYTCFYILQIKKTREAAKFNKKTVIAICN
jgi:hypothetical protein